MTAAIRALRRRCHHPVIVLSPNQVRTEYHLRVLPDSFRWPAYSMDFSGKHASQPDTIHSSGQIDVPNLPYLLFDAGGTVVFPNVKYLLEQMKRVGWRMIHPRQLYESYYRLIHKGDQAVRRNPKASFFPKGYASDLFVELGRRDDVVMRLAREIQRYHIEQENLWTFTYPWVRQTLESLRGRGYRMSVLSNSDGRAKAVIDGAGLGGCFERVFDSKTIGHEKPAPRAFKYVLDKLNLSPSQVIYIGDIYEIDVKGANRAGLGAILIDPLEKYSNAPGVHIHDLRELPARLAELRGDAKACRQLFYFKKSGKHSPGRHPGLYHVANVGRKEESGQPEEQQKVLALNT